MQQHLSNFGRSAETLHTTRRERVPTSHLKIGEISLNHTSQTATIDDDEGLLHRVMAEIGAGHVREQLPHETVDTLNEEVDRIARLMPEPDDFTDAPGQVKESIKNGEGKHTSELVIERIDSTKYVTEVLKKNPEVRDTYGRPRPTYEVGGRTVVFRNRMEIVDISGIGVTAVAVDSVPPFDISTLRNPEKYPIDELNEFNRSRALDSSGNILSVPNTPLGIVETAVVLGAESAVSLRDKLLEGNYSDPACKEFVDGLLGVLTINDAGNALESYDTDGYAVMLGSLMGDVDARRAVRFKLDALRRLEIERKQNIREQDERYVHERQERGVPLPEPLSLEKMFVVHSTSHELEFDEKGNAIFRPAGQYKESEIVPTASWHVTINSSVFTHTWANGAWGAQNRLVIAPLLGVMRETQDRLEVLDGVDTWFVVSPGEEVKVPSPIIIEATDSGEELIRREGNKVKFLFKKQYSEAERRQIDLLAHQYGAVNVDDMKGSGTTGADTLKEACLQMVLAEKGLSIQERDRPATDGHGMASSALAERVLAAAYNLGVRSGAHFHHPEDRFENQGAAQVIANLSQRLNDSSWGSTYTAARPDGGVALGARRQALVNGCLPAAPQFIPVKDADYGLWA